MHAQILPRHFCGFHVVNVSTFFWLATDIRLIYLGSSFVKDENAFLFTLANPTGARPTKLPQSDGNSGIWCNPSCGPGFGLVNGVCIWFMNTNPSSNCGINNIYKAFQTPQDQPFTNFIYGNTTAFTMNYLEIFGLKQN